MERNALKYLDVRLTLGGTTPVAHDAYLIEPDGLTPVWDVTVADGIPLYWSQADAWWPTLHSRVIEMAGDAATLGPWSRVSLLCHYVSLRTLDTSPEIPPERNHYKERAPYKPRARVNGLPDIL